MAVFVVAQLRIHDRDRYSFREESAFRAWADSDEYREIAKDRIAASDGPVLLVHGIG